MKITRLSSLAAVGAIAALTLAGCAANEGGATPETEGTDGAAQLSGEIVAGGSSAQEVAVGAWRAAFQETHPDVNVAYDPTGSGGGRDNFISGANWFSGSDRAFTTDEIAESTFAGCVEGTDIIEIPAYISPIAVIINLEGFEAGSTLNLDAKTLAGIFAGQITNWNDEAIAALNPDAELPDVAITPVHRSDDSGTTENFTDYLFQAAPDVWTYEADGVWPIEGGESGNGTSGVVDAVSGGNGTIGYADASRAADFTTVAIQVGEEFVPYSPEAAAAIVDASGYEEGRAEGDLAVALDRATEDSTAYPIVLISYEIACQEYADAERAPLVKAFLEYSISEEGQQAAAEAAGSAPISDATRADAQAALDLIVVSE